MKKKTENKLNRREFVATAATSFISLYGGNLFAATNSSDHRLVVVFLRGGADGLSILPPSPSAPDYGIYQAARGAEAVQNAISRGATDRFRLHPALSPLVQAVPSLSFVAGVGSVNQSRSHFEQMDIIESGMRRAGPVGYLNRLLGVLGGDKSPRLPAVGMNSTLPLALRGKEAGFPVTNPNLFTGLNNGEYVTQTDAQEKASALWKDSHRRQGIKSDNVLFPVGIRLNQGIEGIKRARNESTANISSSQSYGDEKFRAAARLIKSDRDIRLVTVDIGGWDDHIGIGVNGGKFHNRLESLSTALAAFCTDLKAMGEWQRTTIVVMTEFGRRVEVNGNQGLDHGRGGVMMVMGGKVHPRKQVRRSYSLANLDQGDVRVTIDYREVFAEILQKSLKISRADLRTVFPEFSIPTNGLGLIKS